ncbi:MAG TPA: prolipoprotein diacylglyceryl transferase [Actinomycetota bacterium]|nr:prolipoprotein diacylglyceryl transferase [Actinomycetota bacterium]
MTALAFGPLEWSIVPRIELGPLAVSPHGIGIAVGVLLGARMLVRRSERRGGPTETDIYNGLFWALIGAVVGARLAYVVGHLSEVTSGGDDPLGVLKVWEGGISLLGGIVGAVLAAVPYLRRHGIPFWSTMDLAAPCLAFGIFVGRVGDLVIGDHLGKPTTWPLGWRCAGEVGGPAARSAAEYRGLVEAGRPPSLGCFDVVLHQTALYDFLSAGLLCVVLLWLARRTRNVGVPALVFVVWYGAMRVVTDFLRVDKRYFGLTGSQITSLTLGLLCLAILARYRGAPPRWTAARAPSGPAPATERDETGHEAPARAAATTQRSGKSAP